MPSAIIRISAVLTCLIVVVTLLVMGISRALPRAGAIAFAAYHEGKTDIYAVDMARGTLLNLTNDDDNNDVFAFSPDGQKLMFKSNTERDFQLYLMEVKCPDFFAACGEKRQLIKSETDILSPRWSPDGKQITYSSDNEVYVLNIESGVKSNITQHPTMDFASAWSPDGRQIAFLSDRDTTGSTEIYLADSDGSHVQRITFNEVWDYPPIWSPDGNQIAFVSHNDSGDDIFAMNMRDGSLHNLTPDFANVSSPVWSTHGSQIAFWIDDPRGAALYVIDTLQGDRGEVRLFVTGSSGEFIWLPDGRFAILNAPKWDNPFDVYVLDGDQMHAIARQVFSSLSWWP